MNIITIKKLEGRPGWYFVSIFGRMPFKFLQHGGWIFLNIKWIFQYAVNDPIKRRNAKSNRHKNTDASDYQCPVCGYYCLGRGGFYCIDKPNMVKADNTQDQSGQ